MDSTDKTHPRVRGTQPEVRQTARDLRTTMTPAERKLWETIRDRRLNGLKFRRQCPVGDFILDFYCPIRKLVIEVDGSIHEETAERDEERSRKLNEFGYKVIRFSNEEVMSNLPSVLNKIIEAAK